MKRHVRKRFKKKSCEPKIGYDNKDSAYAAMRRLNKRNFIFHKMSVYHCQFCKKWHIGKESIILYEKFNKLVPQT